MDEQVYTARDVARIFGLQESRVLYWARTGVVGPSVRRAGRGYYTFQDLITVKTAKELIERGLSLQAVRKNLAALRAALPDVARPLSQMRIVSDGDRLVVVEDARAFEPLSGQMVMDFAVSNLWSEVAEVMELPVRGQPQRAAATEPAPTTAYGWFQRGCSLDGDGDGDGDGAGGGDAIDPARADAAEAAYRKAIELDPRMAAAHTNLGNLAHRRGRRGEARELYEKAIELDPEQPEARYNLANLLDDLGETERAIAEWTRVAAIAPDFADAHFNLGVALLRRDDEDGTRLHLRRYLALDPEGEWAAQAREILSQLGVPERSGR